MNRGFAQTLPIRHNLPLRFFIGVLSVTALTMMLFLQLMQPAVEDIIAMIFFLTITSVISLAVGYGAYRFGWIRRSPKLSWSFLIIYALSSVLTFVNVWLTARLMFLNQHDLTLATVLLIFAAGIAFSFGYFLSATLTDSITALNLGADQIANGNLQTRVEVRGRDEMSQLALAFNNMAAQLETAKQKQQEVDQLRRDLIAWVGHDLRTPLSSVRAIVEALADGVIEDEQTQQRYLRTAQRDINSLSSLIDDLFEMAQIDAGGLKLDLQPNSISDLLSDTLESFSSLTAEKGIKLGGEVASGIGPSHFDAKQIGRVLSNLIGNAIRHTPKGGRIHVRAWPVRQGIIVDVYDTGEGISAKNLSHVFEQFFRGEQSRNRTTGGSGLGLAISKGIVEAHGGQIGVESKEREWSRFYFTLPHRSKNYTYTEQGHR